MRILTLVAALFSFLFGGVSVNAGTMYLNYTSIVTYESISSGYDYGIHVGDTITHTYLVDKDLPGYWMSGARKIYMQDEVFANGKTNKYYYSELISGNLLVNPYYPPAFQGDIIRYSLDQFLIESGTYLKSMSWAGADFGSHLVNSSDANERGALFYHYLGVNGYQEDRILFNVVSFSVSSSPPTPVPEPSAFLMAFTFLLGGGAYIRRRFCSRN